MTLGGRLNNAEALKRVKILGEMWPLLMGNASVMSQARQDFWPYTGLLFNVNLSKGKEVPETQCYVSASPCKQASEKEADLAML